MDYTPRLKKKYNEEIVSNLKGNYDGDSVTLEIDLEHSTSLLGEKIRLCGIDTLEIRGPDRELGTGGRGPNTTLISKNFLPLIMEWLFFSQ